MTYSTVVTILSAVITGGFVLVFIEIGNRKNREEDRYRLIMEPFMKKLTAYFNYINWVSLCVTGPKPETNSEKVFKRLLMRDIGGYGSRLLQGGRYDIDSFKAAELYSIGEKINQVWYLYDKGLLNRLQWAHANDINPTTKELMDKELSKICSGYLQIPNSVAKIAKISGDFYTDEYQPIEYEPEYHELIVKLYHIQSVFVLLSLFFVLIALCMIIWFCFPLEILKALVIFVVLLFGICLLFLLINVNKQLAWLNVLRQQYRKMHHKLTKNTKKEYRPAY